MAISIGRLSGGNTPADGSDPRTFPAIWNATADTLEAGVIPTSLTSPSTGQLLQYNGTNWVNVGQAEAGAIPVFADSTARSSAIPSPSEGMITYLEDTDAVDKYDGSAFVPVGVAPAILQVVSTTKTDTFSTSSTSYVDVTGLSVTITPTSTTSKVLVSMNVSLSGNGAGVRNEITLLRNSTQIANASTKDYAHAALWSRSPDGNLYSTTALGDVQILDTPATTSAITYKPQVRVTTGVGYVNRAQDGDIYRGISYITVMEVAG